MMKKHWINRLLLISIACLFYACTEDYDFEREDFENILIVDGNITNQLKKHKVFLGRSFAFNSDPTLESGAQVEVRSSEGERFLYREKDDHSYEAVTAFAAEAGKTYSVYIITSDGKEYASEAMGLPAVSHLEVLEARATTNDLDEPGIGVYINAESPTNDAHLYRFEYEETYKIVAPRWTPYDAIVRFEGTNTFRTDVILRETEERTCYGTAYSEKIHLQSTLDQSLDRIDQEEIIFLPLDNPKLIHRYAILVRLLVENPKTYTYFETLKNLSVKSSNFFNDIQPGYLSGNLFQVDDDQVKVGGFFRVSAAEEQRIFLNLSDYYPQAPTPPYFTGCGTQAPTTTGTRGTRQLLNVIYAGTMRYFGLNNQGDYPNGGPYLMVPAQCGDCTVLGSNRVPDFWIP